MFTEDLHAILRKNPDPAFIAATIAAAAAVADGRRRSEHRMLVADLLGIVIALQKENARLHSGITKRVFANIQRAMDCGTIPNPGGETRRKI